MSSPYPVSAEGIPVTTGPESPSYEKDCYTEPSNKRTGFRVQYDEALVHEILDSNYVCHVGFNVPPSVDCTQTAPVVLPRLYGRKGRKLYLHGSGQTRLIRLIQESDGLEICVTVTSVDGMVLARSAFHHSINYRSAVVYGTARAVTTAVEKVEGLKTLVDHVLNGRYQECREPNSCELSWVDVISVDIEHASAKIRSGGPDEWQFDRDQNKYWGGVLPLHQVYGPPMPDGAPSARPDFASYLSQRKNSGLLGPPWRPL